MRSQISRTAFVLGLLAVGAAGATAKPSPEAPSLTLYERADFTGRHAVFHAGAETARQAFIAHSAKSTGVWTLCEGRDPASKCQTVNGPAAKLKIEPAIVRPGVAAVALYERPGLQGRRVVYTFGSDIPPPFRARSARTWGGAWSLCDGAGKCQVVDSERPVAIDIQVGLVKPGRDPERLQAGLVKPGREPERLQLALAEPAPAPQPKAEEAPPPAPVVAAPPPAAPPEASSSVAAAPQPVEIAVAAPPPPPEQTETPPPREDPIGDLADASPPAEPAQSPYVDVPIPPRETAPPAEQQEAPELRAPEPARLEPPPAQVRRVSYACQDGAALTVVFDDGDRTAMVLVEGQRPLALRRTEGADGGGFFYEGSGHVLFGAGARAGYASDGAQPVDCYTRGAVRQLSARDDGEPYYPGRSQRRQYDAYGAPPPAGSSESW